jgi:hypothetical protein
LVVALGVVGENRYVLAWVADSMGWPTRWWITLLIIVYSVSNNPQTPTLGYHDPIPPPGDPVVKQQDIATPLYKI